MCLISAPNGAFVTISLLQPQECECYTLGNAKILPRPMNRLNLATWSFFEDSQFEL